MRSPCRRGPDAAGRFNARRSYTIRLVTNERTEEVQVGPVTAPHSDEVDAVADVLARAGGRRDGGGCRHPGAGGACGGAGHRPPCGDRQLRPFNLILCENLHGAAEIFRRYGVVAHLPEALRAFAGEHIGFVDTVIARMVPPLTPELRAADPSLILVEPYKELPVDRDAFVGPIPPVVGMIPYAPFAFFTERKLYIHNAGHATLGYLGYLRGYEYGYEALADDEIYFQARGAMEESALALTRKFRLPPGALLANIDDLLHRFGNRALGDTILRLGRDRCASSLGDRLARRGCQRTGPGRHTHPPCHRHRGRAAVRIRAILVRTRLQARIAAEGIEKVAAEVTGIAASSPLFAQVMVRYAALKRTVLP